MKILIDPGHGGRDPGATHEDKEAEQFFGEGKINLMVALELSKILAGYGLDVKLSRYDNTYLSLMDRATMANEWGADYFISIHHNAGGGDGYEVIHSICGGRGRLLAIAVAKEFKDIGQNPHGGWGTYCKESEKYPGKDYHCVIRETNMPAIITEFAYIDNDRDNDIIDTDGELIAEATAIAGGIVKAAA